MEWYMILAVIGAGFLAGFINIIAGSGSLVSLPLLMFLGLPANVANGTNRIAILLQNVVGVASFKQQNVLDTKKAVVLGIPAVIGALAGAFLAVELNEQIMHIVIGSLLFVMFFLILFKPGAWVKGQAGKVDKKPSVFQYIVFFFIGMYGGFIQAGVGLFLLAGLVLSAGMDLVKANAIKVFIVMFFTVFALAVFMYQGLVDYKMGLILAVGNMLGAFVASRFSVSWGPKVVRVLLLVIIALSALKLLGLFSWIKEMIS